MESQERQAHHVQSLRRGLSVIRAFDRDHPDLTLSEVARACELTRATARRFLLTLVDLGYVHTDGRVFRLSPKILELGYAYLSSISLPEVALPHLEALVAEIHESSSVCVLDGHDIVYIARIPTSRIMTVAINVGTRFPAHATSVGRLLLAHLPPEQLAQYLGTVELKPFTGRTLRTVEALRVELDRVRRQGYALVDQELEEGLRSMATGIHDATGTVAAAVNVSVHASRTSVEVMRRQLLPRLLAAAARIDADLRVAAPAGRVRRP